MPKITDAQYVTDTNGTGYIVGYQDGVFCRWPITMAVANKWLSGSGVPNVGIGVDDDYYLDLEAGDVYQKVDGAWGTALTNIHGAAGTNGTNGANGVNGTNGADGVGVPSGGATNQVLAKASSDDYDFHWVNAASGGVIIDLSSATSDYALAVGETAKVTYSSATSIPLHVATVEGVYELSCFGVRGSSPLNGNDITLAPNSGGLAAGIVDFGGFEIPFTTTSSGSAITTGSWQNGSSSTTLKIGLGLAVNITAKISTYTTNKSSVVKALCEQSGTIHRMDAIASVWDDTTTPWVSLGTITFPFAQSGIISIKRIL